MGFKKGWKYIKRDFKDSNFGDINMKRHINSSVRIFCQLLYNTFWLPLDVQCKCFLKEKQLKTTRPTLNIIFSLFSFHILLILHSLPSLFSYPYFFFSGWKRWIRRAAQVERHSSFSAQMPAGELPYKRQSISNGSFLRRLAWRIWMTGKKLLKLVHKTRAQQETEKMYYFT